MTYDLTIYLGTARYYRRGRAPYSRDLAATLASELSLDGYDRLIDVGTGPGILAIELAHLFEGVVALDPDADMLAEAARYAAEEGIANITWLKARAEEIPSLDLGVFRLATFGQSFHWTDRERVAEALYDLLEPGGAIALVAHSREGRPLPDGPGYPQIPHEAIRALIDRYLGPRRRAGQGFATRPADRYEHALARTRFGVPRHLFAPGRPDIVQDVNGVLASYLSTSFAAPHLFGDRLAAFEADLRAELESRSPTGLFWDWPGDTELVLARKL